MTQPYKPEHASVVAPPQSRRAWLSNEVYDVLKFLAQIFFPALGTLYFALADIWGLPYAQQVVGSIVAFDVFLGVILGLSTKSYNKSDDKYAGAIDVVSAPGGKKVYSLELNGDPEDLDVKKEVTFRINPRA